MQIGLSALRSKRVVKRALAGRGKTLGSFVKR